jgi:hypothetical protein
MIIYFQVGRAIDNIQQYIQTTDKSSIVNITIQVQPQILQSSFDIKNTIHINLCFILSINMRFPT